MSEPIAPENACVLGHSEPVEATDGYLCRRHYGWILDTLREIEELWALRGVVVMPELTTFNNDRHGSRDGSPAPGRIGVMALSDARNSAALEAGDVPDVISVLGSWYLLTCEELPLRDEPDRVTFVHILGTLRGQRRWIAQQLWVDDYAAELVEIHKALALATGAGMWPHAIGACPNCGRSLYVTPGVDAISCRRCHSVWSGADYLRLRLILEREAERKRNARIAEANTAAADAAAVDR